MHEQRESLDRSADNDSEAINELTGIIVIGVMSVTVLYQIGRVECLAMRVGVGCVGGCQSA